MAAAAVSSSLACPLRRSTRLAHAHHPRRCTAEPDNDHDSSSDDLENELTPRALRALKRQRLALDPHGLPLRTRKRRKENTTLAAHVARLPPPPRPHTKRPSHQQPLPPRRTRTDDKAHPRVSSDSPHSTATHHAPPPSSTPDPAHEHRPPSPSSEPSRPALSIPLPPMSRDASPSSSDTEPLTPLTPLTPSPESSPSLPGHDRPTLSPSPPQEPLPQPISVDALPMPDPSPNQQPSSTDSFSSPPLPPSLDTALDTLIPFDSLHSQFDPELSVQIPPPSTPPQLQGLELQAQFHSFPQHQLYVPPNPVFVRDREINIWKLACQERVDCLLRRYGVDYIKALVESQARSVSRETPSSGTATVPPSQTKFRLYTPASYTYSLSSWGSTSESRRACSADDQADDAVSGWPMDDPDWADPDVDMEDEDDDDYDDDDDDDDDGELERDGDATLEAVEGLVITDTDAPPTTAMDVDSTRLDDRPTTASVEPPAPPHPTPDPSPRPSTPIPHAFPSPPLLTPLTLPPLSSLHVPLLSEPPRAFMGRGTPPDRQRLIEWSMTGRFSSNGVGPPLYLSPVPQRDLGTDIAMGPMPVDPPMHPTPHPAPTHGEWTSFLYSMLEGDGVGVDTSVGGAGHASEPTWYELGLAPVPPVVSEPALELTPARTATAAVEQPVDDGSNSSSTLRFALG